MHLSSSYISFSIDNIVNLLNLSWEIFDLRYDFVNISFCVVFCLLLITNLSIETQFCISFNLSWDSINLSSQLRHCGRHRLHMPGRWCLHGRCRLGTTMRVAWSISTSLMAWASSPRSGLNHQPFVMEKKTTKESFSQTAPTDDSFENQ